MDEKPPVLPSFSPSSVPIITSSAGENGFYVDTPPGQQNNDTIYISPDRKYLIIGCALGALMLILLVIGCIFTVKLYLRKRANQASKEKHINDEEYYNEGDQWMMETEVEEGGEGGERSSITLNNRHLSLPASTNVSNSGSYSGSSKKLQLSSILDPGSQFSLAIQRASEIPDSPATPTM